MMEDGKNRRDPRDNDRTVDIDMNPMVDLAFLLLTFFMLTTTFSKPQTMEVRMPVKPDVADEDQDQAVKESKAVTVVLGPENEIFWFQGITDPDVQTTQYGAKGIREVLTQLNTAIPGMVVLIKPMDNSTFENLVDVLDEMTVTGVKRYAIVDPEPRDLELIEGL